MFTTKSAVLIDDSAIDNFLNYKILQNAGFKNVITFTSASSALQYLSETKVRFEFIFVDVYMSFIDGFEFISKFNELKLHRKQGKIYILTNSLDPSHKALSSSMNIKFLEKPLNINALSMQRKSVML
jgi:two-component SAPR family response regulator